MKSKDIKDGESKVILILFVGTNPESHNHFWHWYQAQAKWLT